MQKRLALLRVRGCPAGRFAGDPATRHANPGRESQPRPAPELPHSQTVGITECVTEPFTATNDSRTSPSAPSPTWVAWCRCRCRSHRSCRSRTRSSSATTPSQGNSGAWSVGVMRFSLRVGRFGRRPHRQTYALVDGRSERTPRPRWGSRPTQSLRVAAGSWASVTVVGHPGRERVIGDAWSD